MSVRLYYRQDSTTTVEIVDAMVVGGFSVQHCAEEGRVGNGTITVLDPLGVFDFLGHRTIYLVEEDIEDVNDRIIWRGYVAARSIARGTSELTEAARVWEISVVDQNSVLSRRLQVGSDAKRPAETDVARVTWLVNTAEAGVFDDTTTYLHTDRTLSMDPVDYNGQPNLSVIDDAAQTTGKNYWADYFNEVPGIGIWYGHAGEPDYVASIGISNVLSEVDGDAIFEPSHDTKLSRDPSRVFSGVYLPYDGGYVYKTNPTIATTFAARDVSMASANVKTSAKAARRANRYLNELDTEDDRITTSLILPSTHINFAKAGQWINVRFTHIPGYETTTPMRILSRTIKQLTPVKYQLDLELSGGDVLPPPGNGSARLYSPFNRDGLDLSPVVGFHTTGDAPQAGRVYWPLVGPMEYVHNDIDDYYEGIRILGEGTVTITLTASIIAVVNGAVTAIFEILVNDVSVASGAVPDGPAGLRSFVSRQTIVAEDLEVHDGDVVTALAYFEGTTSGGGKVPAGVGAPNEYLQIIGDIS